MKKLFFFLCLLMASSIAFSQNTATPSLSVYFDTDKHTLKKKDKNALNDWLAELQQADAYKVEIVAHTDVRGSESYNQALAERRATSVKAVLQPKLRQEIQVNFEAVGESQAKYGENKELQWQDRRVDIIAYEKQYQSLDELFGLLQGDPVQRFQVDADKATVITGKSGTQLWIKGYTFVDANGEPITAGQIEVQLTEAYDYADMLLSGLSTHSPEGVLQTGGMFRIEANYEGQAVQLADGSSIRAGMPSQGELQQGMSLFVPQSAGQPDVWVNTGQAAESTRQDALVFPPRPKYPVSKTVPMPALDTTAKPSPPRPPRNVYAPRRPHRAEFRINPPALTAMTMGKRKIKAKEQKAYEKAVDKYLRDSTKYVDVHYPNYQKKVAAHQQDLRDYKYTLKRWRQQIQDDRLKEWENLKAAYQDLDYAPRMAAYRKELKAWQATKDAMIRDFELEYLEKGEPVTNRDLGRYFFSINQLGWINCDRFRNIPPEDKMILAWQDVSLDTRIYVLAQSAQSFLRTSYRDGQKRTAALPKNEHVKVVAIQIKDGKPQLAIQEGTVAEIKGQSLAFSAAGFAELKKHFGQLGGV